MKKYSGDLVLDTMSEYAVNRNNIIYGLITKAFRIGALGKRKVALLEFGAGRGEFIDRFASIPKIHTAALEIDPKYLTMLRKKHEVFSRIDQIESKVDYIFAIDVLEHIEHDAKSLDQLFGILKRNGKLFIYVPARPELYSQFDRHIGHYRRYVLPELIFKVRMSGFVVEEAYYHDFMGYFAAIFNKLTSNGQLNPKMVNLYDKFIFPLSVRIEAIFHPPFGKSIVLVAKKTSS